MVNIMLCGCNGKMGRVLTSLIENDEKSTVICGVDLNISENKYPVYAEFCQIKEKPDVIIDFSNPAVLSNLLEYAISNNIPVVAATTGYNDAQIAQIKEASEKIPVFFTFNMSLGINLLSILLKKCGEVLGEGFDVEIIEKHHNQKIDAPSGTALMLAKAVSEALPYDSEYVYERQSVRKKREKNEIGIHAVRGGTIVGEHEVIFAGKDEVITLSHSAYSKEVFAVGALRAAKFICGKPAGMYDMNKMLF